MYKIFGTAVTMTNEELDAFENISLQILDFLAFRENKEVISIKRFDASNDFKLITVSTISFDNEEVYFTTLEFCINEYGKLLQEVETTLKSRLCDKERVVEINWFKIPLALKEMLI